jgi:hypothetical protein
MDSGGLNGRHWQRPLQSPPIKLWGDIERKELYAAIALHHFLKEHFEIDQSLTRWIRRESQKQGKCSYQEYAELLAEHLGLDHLSGDYTYNWENDLSQDFQFTVVGPKGVDWIYNEACYLIIESHNGADARGGFSDPVVCKPLDPESWLDVVCGISFTAGKTATGASLTDEALQELDESFQVGYTSSPSHEFSKQIATIHSFSDKENKFEVTLVTGERVSGCFYFQDANGGYTA